MVYQGFQGFLKPFFIADAAHYVAELVFCCFSAGSFFACWYCCPALCVGVVLGIGDTHNFVIGSQYAIFITPLSMK